MKPRKELVDKAYKDSAIDKAALMISLAYVTMSVANNYMDEANDYLKPYGINIGELKLAHNRLMKSTDSYFRTCVDMFGKEFSVLDYFDDVEHLEKVIRDWSGVDKKMGKI